MGTFEYECEECGRVETVQPGDVRSRGLVCFKCHLGGLSFSFRGPQGGKDSFHNDTIKSVQDGIVSSAAAQGREVRPKTKVNYA
jgi:hypothetical protein